MNIFTNNILYSFSLINIFACDAKIIENDLFIEQIKKKKKKKKKKKNSTSCISNISSLFMLSWREHSLNIYFKMPI